MDRIGQSSVQCRYKPTVAIRWNSTDTRPEKTATERTWSSGNWSPWDLPAWSSWCSIRKRHTRAISAHTQDRWPGSGSIRTTTATAVYATEAGPFTYGKGSWWVLKGPKKQRSWWTFQRWTLVLSCAYNLFQSILSTLNTKFKYCVKYAK